jgi:hypothetical integral membrane protein (TIGR02206 family)
MFHPYGTEHLALVLLFLAGCLAAAALGRALRGTDREPAFRRALAVTILVVTVPFQVVLLLPGEYDVRTSLPLQVCDLAWMLAAYALLSRDDRAARLLHYWALTLVPQAIATPDLVQGFPHPRYLMFWAMHFLTVWAAVYLTFGLGVRPTWRGYRWSLAGTAAWAAVVMAFNAVAGTNYLYLNAKPAVASALDLFGPWPGYVVAEAVVVAVVWALLTRPWTRRDAADRTRPAATRARLSANAGKGG